jgi:outer membrane protein assembly factor BamD
MFNKKKLLFLSIFIIFCYGCLFINKDKNKPSVKQKSQKKAPRTLNAEDYYKKAMKYYEKKHYFSAQPEFKNVKDNFPLSPFAVLSELKIADCHYFQEEYEEARLSYENFKKFHPTHLSIPYVEYQIGMSYFEQIRSIDRDQVPAENAMLQFEYLISKYPDSVYIKGCREKIAICRTKLVAHEFYIGKFYYKSENYKAAISRFRGLLENYPPSVLDSEIIFFLGNCYLKLENKSQAKSAFLILTEKYPDTKYSKEAEKLLESFD